MNLALEMGLAGLSPVEDSELPFSLLSWSKFVLRKPEGPREVEIKSRAHFDI